MKDEFWMVRAGKGAEYIDDFIEGGYVAIGWEIDGFGEHPTKEVLAARLTEAYPNESAGTINVWAAQIARYFNDISVGDQVITYNPTNRLYYIGIIGSDVTVREHYLQWKRMVTWTGQVRRDVLRTPTRKSLGSIATLFKVRDQAAADILGHIAPIGADTSDVVVPPEETSDDVVGEGEPLNPRDLLRDAVSRSAEFIEDRIARLTWEQLQELVAEILQAMGYRTRVSERGPDRGVDVFASPDGLGLQEPRIFAEVKHRPGTQIGSHDIRSFLGGRQAGDKCLFVSTGGFTKDAKYEAERSSIPITLITLPELRKLLVEHYDKMSPSGTALVPLERIYWPG